MPEIIFRFQAFFFKKIFQLSMFKKTLLANGTRILSEHIPHVHTVAVGVWIDVGSRDESLDQVGYAHFIEHMLFKGTRSRTASQIARELDSLGGASNGFTSNETTCYFATVLDNHLKRLVNLFADILLNSEFSEEEIERERQVILQEISMVDDTPDDLIHELFSSEFWQEHPLGLPVLGSRQSVTKAEYEQLKIFFRKYYQPENIIISAAGNLNHQNFVDLWEDHFGENTLVPSSIPDRSSPTPAPAFNRVYYKPIEQVHLLLGLNGLAVNDERRYSLLLLNTILGGNMSSGLFQEIREKRGLAYSVFSFTSSFIDCGSVGIYLGTEAKMVNESLNVCKTEVEKLLDSGYLNKLLTGAREYSVASVFLAGESSEAIMTRNARNELYFGKNITVSEILTALNAVTVNDLIELSRSLFANNSFSGIALGPVKDSEINWTSC
jgi:predicted Zn-dependent peptidase